MKKSKENLYVPIQRYIKTCGSTLLGPNACNLYASKLNESKIYEIVEKYSDLLLTLRANLENGEEVLFRHRAFLVDDILASALRGSYSSLRVIAVLMFFEDYFPHRRQEGINILNRLSEANYYLAKFDLFSSYYTEGMGKEYLYLLEELVASDYPPAICFKADRMVEGCFYERDIIEAEKYWQKASTLGNFRARRKLPRRRISSRNIFSKLVGLLSLIPSTITAVYLGARGIEDDRIAI